MLATTALLAFFFDATNAQALALPQRVKAQTLVRAQYTALGVYNWPWFFGNVAVQKLTKRAFANEANSG